MTDTDRHDVYPNKFSPGAGRSHAPRTAALAVAPNAAAKLIAAPNSGTQEQPMADDIIAPDPTLAAEVRRRARLADFAGARAALEELRAVDAGAAVYVDAEVFGADDEEGWTR